MAKMKIAAHQHQSLTRVARIAAMEFGHEHSFARWLGV